MYTSGTTGDPKGMCSSLKPILLYGSITFNVLGVMHTHGSLVATQAAVVAILGGLSPKDVYISYLPLAHVFERDCAAAVIGAGGCLGFYHGVRQIFLRICQSSAFFTNSLLGYT